MFGWFRSKCPVDADVREWVDWRAGWLIGQFGLERLIKSDVVLPTAKFFTAPYDGTEKAVRPLLDQICAYMDIDPSTIELEFYYEGSARGIVNAGGAAGLYYEHDGRIKLALEVSKLADSMSVAATLSHELSHAHLLGGKRVSRDAPDHEPLTDLTAIFFGMGIFIANSSLRDKCYSDGRMHYFQIGRQGYLPDAVIAYGMAVFAWLRNETRPTWNRHVRLDIRAMLRQSLAWLRENRNVEQSLAERCLAEQYDASPYSGFPDGLLAKLGIKKLDDDSEAKPQPEAKPQSETTPHSEATPDENEQADSNDMFSEASILVGSAAYGNAISLLNQLITNDATDGEAYCLRAKAFLGRNKLQEAMNDATSAVKYLQYDSDAHSLRGQIFYAMKKYETAVEELSLALSCLNASRGQNNESLATILYHRGLAAMALEDDTAALADFTRAIRAVPTWPSLFEARAEAHTKLGEASKAVADLADAELWSEIHGEDVIDKKGG